MYTSRFQVTSLRVSRRGELKFRDKRSSRLISQGPPSAVKDKDFIDPKKESPYELLLQQQKVFLQWQTENGQIAGPKQKIILPAPTNPQQSSAISSEAYKLKCSKLEDMKGEKLCSAP